MYDWLYVYNQFIAQLPDTFDEFRTEWLKYFPNTFDNKVLAYQCGQFGRTSLGDLFDKCTNDAKFKDLCLFRFDTVNGCCNYEGTQMLSHYHEAAYDAHMTGVVFQTILQMKADGDWSGTYPR
jgi:hypothetical protein